MTFCTHEVKKKFLFLTLFTSVSPLLFTCHSIVKKKKKNGLGCKWLVHVKVFSTLILDSRYFYSREEKSVSSSGLMLRDSRLYSSLACSVYSICWVFLFFLGWNNMQIFILHFVTKDDSHSVLRSAENISSFFELERGWWNNKIGSECEWICRSFLN